MGVEPKNRGGISFTPQNEWWFIMVPTLLKFHGFGVVSHYFWKHPNGDEKKTYSTWKGSMGSHSHVLVNHGPEN